MESEEQLTPVSLQSLFRGLCERAQALGRSGDFESAWAACEAAEGIEKKLTLAQRARGDVS